MNPEHDSSTDAQRAARRETAAFARRNLQRYGFDVSSGDKDDSNLCLAMYEAGLEEKKSLTKRETTQLARWYDIIHRSPETGY